MITALCSSPPLASVIVQDFLVAKLTIWLSFFYFLSTKLAVRVFFPHPTVRSWNTRWFSNHTRVLVTVAVAYFLVNPFNLLRRYSPDMHYYILYTLHGRLLPLWLALDFRSLELVIALLRRVQYEMYPSWSQSSGSSRAPLAIAIHSKSPSCQSTRAHSGSSVSYSQPGPWKRGKKKKTGKM